MKTLFKASLLASLACLSACKHNQTESSAQNESATVAEVSATNLDNVTLKVGESVEFGKNTLTFMELSGDSRCPKGLECVQAGKAEVVLLLASGDEAKTLTLNTARKKARHMLGHSIEVLSVSPYPKEGYFTEKENFKLNLKITKLAAKDYTIIDVRSAKEVAEGSYPNSINIIHDQIADEIAKLNLDKTTPIALYCRSGRRAGWAQQTLEELGYSHVVNGINQTNMHLKLGTAKKF